MSRNNRRRRCAAAVVNMLARPSADAGVDDDAPGYIEYTVPEIRIMQASRAPLDAEGWTEVDVPLHGCDWETVHFALDRGCVVAIACGADEVLAVKVALAYEIQWRIVARYEDGLLWFCRPDSRQELAKSAD